MRRAFRRFINQETKLEFEVWVEADYLANNMVLEDKLKVIKEYPEVLEELEGEHLDEIRECLGITGEDIPAGATDDERAEIYRRTIENKIINPNLYPSAQALYEEIKQDPESLETLSRMHLVEVVEWLGWKFSAFLETDEVLRKRIKHMLAISKETKPQQMDASLQNGPISFGKGEYKR